MPINVLYGIAAVLAWLGLSISALAVCALATDIVDPEMLTGLTVDQRITMTVVAAIFIITLGASLWIASLGLFNPGLPARRATFRRVVGFIGAVGVVTIFTVSPAVKDDTRGVVILLFMGFLAPGMASLFAFLASVIEDASTPERPNHRDTKPA